MTNSSDLPGEGSQAATSRSVEGFEVELEPGAREILFVAPWEDGVPGGEWTCSRCGRSSLSDQRWRLEYRHEAGEHFSFVVCHDCADELEPVRLTVDMRALRRAAAEADGPELSEVAEHAERIVNERGSPVTGVVALRSADVHDLASAAGLTAGELTDRLDRVDALISKGQGFRRDYDGAWPTRNE
ncbi:MAG: hypothetical protein R3343_09120 [Nitriliruptorales bacterium]|nr:hypothetical protein [Nitriliruptorales bacterium]